MEINTVPKLALFILVLTACKKENSEIETGTLLQSSIPVACKLTAVTAVKNSNTTGSITYQYDTNNRLVKTTNGNTTTTYEYDQNGFLLNRTVRYSATYFIMDVLTYKNEKISNIETTKTTGATIGISKTAYEYDSGGKLAKISKTDELNNKTVSIYKDNLLVEQTSNTESFEVNSLGLITKITAITSGSFSSAGQHTRFIFNDNGQVIKRQNVDKNGIVVNELITEYTTIKNVQLNNLVYDNNKGFPSIGKLLPKYLPQKETTFLLDKNSNTLVEFVSFAYENHKVDKNGLLLSYTGFYKTTNPNDATTTTETFIYSGCN